MRQNIPCVVALQERKVKESINKISDLIGSNTIHYANNYVIQLNTDDSFNFKYSGTNLNKSIYNLPKPSLEGIHQYLNSSLAIAAIMTMKDYKTNNLNISEQNIKDALKNTKWPARLEKIENNNINKILQNKNSEIWLDTAHNTSGAFMISNWLKEKIKKDTKIKCNYFDCWIHKR